MIRPKDLLTTQNIIPSALIILLAVFVLANLFPKAKLAAGSALYEKNNFGYQPILTTKISNEARILRQENNFVQVKIANPPVALWAPVSLFPEHLPFPAQLFLRAEAGKLNPNIPPFVEKKLTVRIGDQQGTQGTRQESVRPSVHLLFSVFLLLIALLALRAQLAKNLLSVCIACFLLFYTIYASGLMKTSLESSDAGIVRMLDSIRLGKDIAMRCETPTLLEIAQSRHGNKITSTLEAYPPADARGYLLRLTPIGGAWRLLATDGRARLYFRE
ncbi:MAG: hypothetical protein LBC99_07095 [Spirochaetota bacterium]|nr:hypothetical protein [Spirochaetota bacterium]